MWLRRSAFAASLFALAFFSATGTFAADQIKTQEFLLGQFTSQVTTSQTAPIELYIGDDLTGIVDPVKSLYFPITGVYTGNGTLELQIDSDTNTSQVFTLPSVSTPTYFEILYKDPSTKINPQSAGSYSYTLNIIPTGVTISGLAARGVVTHRYKPPSCGGTPTGDLTSPVFETTQSDEGPAYNSIMWKGDVGTGKVRLKIATSASPAGPWDYRGPESGCATAETPANDDTNWYVGGSNTPIEIRCAENHNGKRYFRYKIQLCKASNCTDSSGTSPRVDDVVISWSP